MADDKLLSMSLDDIIKLKKVSRRVSSSRILSQFRNNTGTRGRANFSPYRRRGRIGVVSTRNLRPGGSREEVTYRYTRGIYRRRGFRVGQRNLPLRTQDRMLQRKRSFALAQSRVQIAKMRLNNKQRFGLVPRRNMDAIDRTQLRRMLLRGSGRGIRRGRGGYNISPDLHLNTFRSNQLSRINTYRNKVNRSQSAAMHNQAPEASSLVVSIENERAGSTSGGRGGRRGMRRRGSLSRLNLPPLQLSMDMYQERNSTPFHTGALNPEIQRMIADIQGKSNPTNERLGTRFSLRESSGVATRGQRGLGRGQLVARQHNQVIDGLNMGLPMTTTCTLNERFGGIM